MTETNPNPEPQIPLNPQLTHIQSWLHQIRRALDKDRPNYEKTEKLIYASLESLVGCTALDAHTSFDLKIDLLLKLTFIYKQTYKREAARLLLEYLLHLQNTGRLLRAHDPTDLLYRTELFGNMKTLALDMEMFDLANEIVTAQNTSMSADAWLSLLSKDGGAATHSIQQRARAINFNARTNLNTARQNHHLLLTRVCDLLNLL